MFVSKRQWKKLEARVSILEKKLKPTSLDQMKTAVREALQSSVHPFQESPRPALDLTPLEPLMKSIKKHN